jgi:hypothetical protein
MNRKCIQYLLWIEYCKHSLLFDLRYNLWNCTYNTGHADVYINGEKRKTIFRSHHKPKIDKERIRLQGIEDRSNKELPNLNMNALVKLHLTGKIVINP